MKHFIALAWYVVALVAFGAALFKGDFEYTQFGMLALILGKLT